MDEGGVWGGGGERERGQGAVGSYPTRLSSFSSVTTIGGTDTGIIQTKKSVILRHHTAERKIM